MADNFEMIVGLEVHAELNTKNKIFCNCSTEFGKEPDSQCCPVCMGMPGALPKLNNEVVKKAIKAGIATNSEISLFSKFDRKNYFYPDLPKGYQISQYDIPICKNGYLCIELPDGEKKINIERIHIEEDAGKILNLKDKTVYDYNRCGVPLIEIVSGPDIRSSYEAVKYLKKLRAILLYLNVSDCKMEEGSLRCDVNISVRKKGENSFGTRCEIKNLNSFNFIEKAINYEFKRQVELIEKGEKIHQETRGFSSKTGETYLMRNKENTEDYRYFPEPDLPPIIVEEGFIKEIKEEIPVLPDERKKKYILSYSLSSDEAEIIVSDIRLSDCFDSCLKINNHPEILANLIIDGVKRLMEESGQILISPLYLSKISEYLSEGKINNHTARKLISEIWGTEKDPEKVIIEKNMWQINDKKYLISIIEKIAENNPKAVCDYRNGKENALKVIIGMAMKETNGYANPVMTNEIAKTIVQKTTKIPFANL